MNALVLYGDFSCPWSYLAARRAQALSQAGTAVDFRAVEHAPELVRSASGHVGVPDLQLELEQVVAMLLPGERLPYSLAGFVPRTKASVAAYAEGYDATDGPALAGILFESFWMHGIDISEPATVQTILCDTAATCERADGPPSAWRCAAPGGTPVSTVRGRSLRASWAEEWRSLGARVVPVVVEDGRARYGVDAVEWLGAQVSRRRLDPEAAHPALPCTA